MTQKIKHFFTVPTACTFIFAIAIVAFNPPETVGADKYVRTMVFRNHESYSPNSNSRYIDFSKSGDLVSFGGAICSMNGRNLGPIVCDESDRINQLTFHPSEERVIAAGKGLTRWEVNSKIDKVGIAYRSRFSPSKTNPAYSEQKLPQDIAELSDVDWVEVSSDGKFLNVLKGDKLKKYRLETGELVSDLAVNSVTRVSKLGTTGSYLLWSKQSANSPMGIWDGESFTMDTIAYPKSPISGRERSRTLDLTISHDGSKALELVDFTSQVQLCVWDLKERKSLGFVNGFEKATSIRYLGDGSKYVVGYMNGKLEIRTSQHGVDTTIEPIDPAVEQNRNELGEGRSGRAVIELATSQDGNKIAVRYPGDELGIFERGGKFSEPVPTVDEFPARVGSYWRYKLLRNGREDGEFIMAVDSVQTIGDDVCMGIVRAQIRNNRIESTLPTIFLTYRPEGLCWAGSIDERGNDYFARPHLLLPASREEKTLEFVKGSSAREKVQIKLQTKEEKSDVFRPGSLAIRVDMRRKSSSDETIDSLWFAKDVGIIKWVDTKENTTLELKQFVPAKIE
jgi:hypothetical protein